MMTLEQKAARKIGSSDAAAICGLDPWKSAFDVWATITKRVPPFSGNKATAAGNALEEAVLAWAFEQFEHHDARRSVSLASIDPDCAEWMTANLDADAVTPRGLRVIVEAKTAGITSPLRHDLWGDEWTDQIPEQYKIQTLHQMSVAGPEYRHVLVAALLPPRGFVMFAVMRDDEAIAAIIEAERRFWYEHVVADVEPDSEPSMDTIKRLRRPAGKEVELPGGLVHAWEQAKALAKEASEIEDARKKDVLLALGDAEFGDYGAGIVTYTETKRKSYIVAESAYRTLRVKHSKGNS